MINKNNIRLSEIDKQLSIVSDRANGQSLFYLDKEHTQPFNGEIFYEKDGIMEYEYEIKNGRKNGLEYIYDSIGKIEQINECRGNVTFGVSKEFDQAGNLTTASVVYNNDYIKIISFEDGKINVQLMNKYGDRLPEELKKLLNLSDKELINYEFKSEG